MIRKHLSFTCLTALIGFGAGCNPAEVDDTALVTDTELETDDATPADLVGTGTVVGDVAYDALMTNQFGAEMTLYQHYGQIVVLDFAAMWCPPCKDGAPDGQEIWETYGPDGLIYITVMVENVDGDTPDASDLSQWVETYGLTHPVIRDEEDDLEIYTGFSFPRWVVIDRTMTITASGGWPFFNIESAVADQF